jgi:hypothetical protein
MDPQHYKILDMLKPYGKNIEIKELTPLYKTLYIFYLNHPEGVSLKNLGDHREELYRLYGEVSGKSKKVVTAKIDNLSISHRNLFSQNKNIINTKIKMTIGEPLSSFYLIDGAPRDPFRINLPQELIHLPEELKGYPSKDYDIRK